MLTTMLGSHYTDWNRVNWWVPLLYYIQLKDEIVLLATALSQWIGNEGKRWACLRDHFNSPLRLPIGITCSIAVIIVLYLWVLLSTPKILNDNGKMVMPVSELLLQYKGILCHKRLLWSADTASCSCIITSPNVSTEKSTWEIYSRCNSPLVSTTLEFLLCTVKTLGLGNVSIGLLWSSSRHPLLHFS